MGIEIERKFLIHDSSWRKNIQQTITIRQGYLSIEADRTVRVRLWGEEGKLTIKSKAKHGSRLEFEYDIPKKDAEDMLESLCLQPQVCKKRHLVTVGKHLWEIDEFLDHNQGLIVAEIELESIEETFVLPDWIGKEVTDDHRFSNSYLSQHQLQ